MEDVIGPAQFVIGLTCGVILVVFGVVPGLLEALSEEVRTFAENISKGWPVLGGSGALVRPRGAERRIGLAGAGFALIVATILAYFSA